MLEDKEAALSPSVATRPTPKGGALAAPDTTGAAQRRAPANVPPLVGKVLAELGDTQALRCLHTFLSGQDWDGGAAELATLLNRLLSCHRVSLAWVSGQALRLRVISDGVLLDEGVAMPELHQALLEAAHQQALLRWPPAPGDTQAGQHITLAHQTLYRVQGLSGVLTIPLAHEGRVWGAMCLERTAHADAHGQPPVAGLGGTPAGAAGNAGFADAQCEWLQRLADMLAPAMVLRHRLEQPWYERGRGRVEAWRLRLSDPRERWLRGCVLAFFGVLSFGVGLPLPYQLTATAHLEGAVQRVMSAPQDGYLRDVLVRPGDVVKVGQVMAHMADEELVGARRAREAEVGQHENAFAEAFARGDRAQAALAQSRLSQARAQMSLIEQQMGRLTITAPFDGVVIAGDLRQQLGAPVKRGDALLTLAPGLDWRVVMEVDEADIAALNKGQLARLRLAAMPDQTIGLLLSRVTPIAKSTPNGLRYEIEAIPTGAGAGARGLRPGLQGVARIEMPARPLLWRATDRLWQWLRMQAWTWL